MIVAVVRVSGAQAQAFDAKTITAGMVGAKLQLEYTDPVWDGLRKTVVFYGATVKDIITDDTLVTIPAEVIARHNVRLTVGVYGVDADGYVVIPTRLADIGTVRPGVKPSGDTTTNQTLPVWAQIIAMIGALVDLQTKSKSSLVDAINEVLGNCGTDENDVQRILQEYLAANPPTVKETDPTVPSWAKQPSKPTYTADEVHALPDTYTPPDQTAQQVGADPAGTASSAVSQHNTDTAAHNDLRSALQALANRVNAVLDSDDTTLDQMSEVVAYIKSNKTLIDSITTIKVSIADIVNDLVTNVADKPLSAAQGVVIKGLIDALSTAKLDADKLTDAINTALAQAKASGEFDGVSPTITTSDYAEVSADPNVPDKIGTLVKITDAEETHTFVVFNGQDGHTPVKGTDYFTDADKAELVDSVLAVLPAAEGVSY